jgi:putative phosphoesterase
MRIAILSDSHDNIWKLNSAMPHLASADVILHCGDIISPFMIKQLIRGSGGKPVHLVWGNNDGDKRMLTEIATEADNIHIHGDFASIDFNGFKVAMNHYPMIAHALAESNKFNVVCYGHDHTVYQTLVGKTLLINPGELMGMNSVSTIAVLNTITQDVEFIEIP